MQNSINPTSTKADTGKVAKDSDVASEDPAVGDSSNSLVNDLVSSVEGDDLSNMSAQSKPQKSDVAAVN